MSVRKFISLKSGKVQWSILVRSSVMNGYVSGDAASIADADTQIDTLLNSLHEERKAA